MKTIYIIIFLFSFFPGYGCSQTTSNSTNTSSQNLDGLCKKPATIWERAKGLPQTQLQEIERTCCEKSLKIIKKYSYQVLPSHQTTCPKGTEKNMAECIGSLHWCEPKTASSDSPYVPLKDLDKLCEIRGGCCEFNLDKIKKNSYVVLNPSVAHNSSLCPKGTQSKRLKCQGALTYCVPKGKLP